MKVKADWKWVLKIFVISIVISMAFSLISESALSGAGYVLSFIVLGIFIIIGIVFDILGVAVTSAKEAPFHSMVSHRQRGASEAIKLLRNAEKVASICNDVVGDICGIISGATAAVIVGNIVADLGYGGSWLQTAVSGAVAGLTIGGKALGKTVAINQNTEIVLMAGKVINSVCGIFHKKRKNK